LNCGAHGTSHARGVAVVRIRAVDDVLGAPLVPGALRHEHVRHLVDAEVSENDQLDFKRASYPKGKESDLATDLAALANHQGGVVVLGVVETDGRAVDTTPLEIGEFVEPRMRQLAAQWIAPYLQFDVLPVQTPEDPQHGFYLLSVAPSLRSPHAVARPNEPRLSYPIRYGRDTRYLSEAEVADPYVDGSTAPLDGFVDWSRSLPKASHGLNRTSRGSPSP